MKSDHHPRGPTAAACLRGYAVLAIIVTALMWLSGCESRQSVAPVAAAAAAAAAVEPVRSAPAAGPATSKAFASEIIDLPDVAVIAQDGRRHRFLADIAGDHLLVINFNFTTCESICPVGNVVMQAVDEQVGTWVVEHSGEQRGEQTDRMPRRSARLLSITIDPDTDTPERLRRAALEAGASTRWLWLTGAPADVELLLRRFGARAVDIQTHDPVFLIGDARSGRFIRISGLPEPAEILRHLAAFDG